MTRCLVCHERFIEQPTWRKLFMFEAPSLLCERCEGELVELTGTRCVRCSRSLELLGEGQRSGAQCYDCMRWQQHPLTRDILERNFSLYSYNAFLKKWMATYKYRGDTEAARFFSQKLKNVYKREFRGYIPVEIPLSKERLFSRGFNQSALLMQGWAEETNVLFREQGEKQSKRKRSERIAQIKKMPFSIREEKKSFISEKAVVLIDDIYTTGTTVRQAALVLKQNGAQKIASLTVAR